jgi:hypothetical protein
MASPLPLLTIMPRLGAIGIIAVLAGVLIVTRIYQATSVIAAVEVAPGAVADTDQKLAKEIVAAFDQAEVAVQHADLDALMLFYAKGYNYHGLKRSDARRVWEEVFTHYKEIGSRHVFTELKLLQTGGVKTVSVACTGGLYGMEKETGKPITIDSWVREVHYLVKEEGAWRFLGNAGGTFPSGPASSAPHHPLF